MNLKSIFTKRNAIVAVVVIAFASVGAYLFFGNSTRESDTASASQGGEVWTCSMHPRVRMSKPG